MQSQFTLTPQRCLFFVKMYWSMIFYKSGCSYAMLYKFKNTWCASICFVNTDLRSLTIICIIYTCYKCLACESKMASILNLIVDSSVGCPLNCPLFPYLKVVRYPLSCPLSCQLYLYVAVVGSLICMAKFPWAAHWQPDPLPTELPTFFMFGSSGLPTELPPVSIYGSSGQPNLHGKIPMGSPLRCPLSCPLFHIWK